MAARPAPRSSGRTGGSRPTAAHTVSARPYRRVKAATKYAKKRT